PESQLPQLEGQASPVHLGKASFSVSSRVALQLGRESISSSITAIVELVKNAYDADAEEVSIRFGSLGTPDAFLVIEDTGDGMTVDDLRDYWMVIGTANKTERRKTAKHRVVTGEKGLGRLGLDRLCVRTEVESIRLGSTEGVRLDVQWDKYEAGGGRLEAIEHDLYNIPNLNLDPITGLWRQHPKGTRLILRGLKDVWDQDSIGELRNELALLVSPFQGPNDFSIKIDTGGVWKDLDGLVTIPKPLLDAANWKVVATLDEEDQMEIRMSSSRHETEYHFKPTPWSDAIKKQGVCPHCGPLKIEFYFFVRRVVNLTLVSSLFREFPQNFPSRQRTRMDIRIFRSLFRIAMRHNTTYMHVKIICNRSLVLSGNRPLLQTCPLILGSTNQAKDEDIHIRTLIKNPIRSNQMNFGKLTYTISPIT
ncbi:ATP-binding protein, partial [Methylacidiphilales bacterium]|nr:ATP-binding protein [Candidatus Methylacidiphilales bacterium]